MTQYSDKVNEVRIQREAELWAKEVKDLHVHSLDSMWYETEESRKLKGNYMVADTTYNSGKVERVVLGKKESKPFVIRPGLTGEELYRSFVRTGADTKPVTY